ncbi:MAG: glycosyltransferase family 2 protein, partial [Paracoccaceae bacterium]
MTATLPSADLPDVDAVVIGRNEGVRLLACLAALQGRVRRVV